MPTSPLPNNLQETNLLTYARAVYRTNGVLPLDLATELMEAGFIVRELEERWDKELGEQWEKEFRRD